MRVKVCELCVLPSAPPPGLLFTKHLSSCLHLNISAGDVIFHVNISNHRSTLLSPPEPRGRSSILETFLEQHMLMPSEALHVAATMHSIFQIWLSLMPDHVFVFCESPEKPGAFFTDLSWVNWFTKQTVLHDSLIVFLDLYAGVICFSHASFMTLHKNS